MPCLVGCLALVAPRFTLVLLVIFTDFIGRAYDTILWPFLGFLFMPLTTMAYAAAINWNDGSVSGGYFALVLIAALIDLGVFGGSGGYYRKRRRRDERIYDAGPLE